MSNEIVKQNTTNVPAYLSQINIGPMGTEDMGTEDTIVPRLKICQPMSQIKQVNNVIRDGEFYNAATGEIFSSGIDFYALLFWRSRIWFSADQKLVGTEIIDHKTKEVKHFGKEIEQIVNNKALYSKGMDVHNYMIALAGNIAIGNPEILICSFQSAAMKASRQMNAQLKSNTLKNIPIYVQQIHATTQITKFAKGSAYMPVFSFPRMATEEEFYRLQALFSQAQDLQGMESVITGEDEVNTETVVKADDILKANERKMDDIPF